MANGEWRMANGEWRMANGEWRVEIPDVRRTHPAAPTSRLAIRDSPFATRYSR